MFFWMALKLCFLRVDQWRALCCILYALPGSMIVPPVRIWFGSVRSEVFMNRWFVIGTWFGYLVRSYLVRYVARRLGTKLFGSVRGPKFRTTVPFLTGTVIWLGTIIHAGQQQKKIKQCASKIFLGDHPFSCLLASAFFFILYLIFPVVCNFYDF